MPGRIISSPYFWSAFAVAALLVAVGIASPLLRGPTVTPLPGALRAGPYLVQAEINPNPPQAGANVLKLTLRDIAGNAVGNARLSAEAVMPAMGAMPAMHAPAEFQETAPGEYRGEFDLAMEGPWPLTLEIDGAAGRGRLILDMSTDRPGLRVEGGDPARLNVDSEIPETGTVRLDAHRRQLIGVTTGTVQRRELDYTIRAAGRVGIDERRLTDVALKFDGWIGVLHANYAGATVRKGEALFTVYNPLLLNAQRELLIAARQNDATLTRGARERLSLWDMSPEQIAELERRGEAARYVTMLAPADGVVTEKNIVAGSAFRAGERLLRVADLSRVWVEAQVYSHELPLLREGMSVDVRLPDVPQRVWRGQVSYISPMLETDTRTARVRVELDNSDGFLRPELYAEMRVTVPLGKRLLVPEDSVLYSGANRVVFVDLGDGRLQPRRVKTGLAGGGWIEIMDGVREGETIVTSGNFLLASESKLKGGIEQW